MKSSSSDTSSRSQERSGEPFSTAVLAKLGLTSYSFESSALTVFPQWARLTRTLDLLEGTQ